jgi:hypothetical protein
LGELRCGWSDMDLWTGLACVKLNPEIKDVDPFDEERERGRTLSLGLIRKMSLRNEFGGMRKAWAISSLSLTRSNCWRLE